VSTFGIFVRRYEPTFAKKSSNEPSSLTPYFGLPCLEQLRVLAPSTAHAQPVSSDRSPQPHVAPHTLPSPQHTGSLTSSTAVTTPRIDASASTCHPRRSPRAALSAAPAPARVTRHAVRHATDGLRPAQPRHA
jgi:hypothetical protein